jgi:uncharacterized protein (TIGR02611 family)
MEQRAPGERDHEHTMFVDEDEDRFAWRARIKRNPTTRRIYRIVVGVVGFAVLAVGILAIPAPGPGWAIVFVGLAILASEFEKADRLLGFARRHVHRWTTWINAQALWVRIAVGLGTLALVMAIFWAYFGVFGVPAWLPGFARDLLVRVPGLE